MGKILKDVYSESLVSSSLGFKGGTCAYFFYQLPRFSVDLDFDFLENEKENRSRIFESVKKILEKHGKMKDSHIKHNTIFFLLSYSGEDHNIKFEVNTRMDISQIKEKYEFKKHLGISMLIAKKNYLFAGKIAALISRDQIAMRDIYDVWFFAKNNWDIDKEALEKRTGKSVKENLERCINIIGKINENQILQGLGELLDEEEKKWVKTKLREETLFLIKNYMLSLE